MGLKGGISIDADSGPLRYVLWCCGGICHQPDTFIQIGSGHTVKCTIYVIICMTLFALENTLRFQLLTCYFTYIWIEWIGCTPVVFFLTSYVSFKKLREICIFWCYQGQPTTCSVQFENHSTFVQNIFCVGWKVLEIFTRSADTKW